MSREWKPGEREIVRLLHSPIYTEKTLEEHWRNRDSLQPKAKKSILFAQRYSIEGFMEAVRCLLTNGILTLEKRDQYLENLWKEIEDVPMNPETECFEKEVLGFPADTHREVVWKWFDERYSKGIAHLLCVIGGTDCINQAAILLHRFNMCSECDSEMCAYNDNGLCRFPLVHGRQPGYTDHDGCIDSAVAERKVQG